MATHLIITNGDHARDALVKAKAATHILAWRDVLNIGPVPETDTLAELSAIRSRHLDGLGWSGGLDLDEVFTKRDDAIRSHAKFERISLWFEHDLYDQLQLLQIIDALAAAGRPAGSFALVQSDRPIAKLWGPALLALATKAVPVGEGLIKLAREGWAAFRQPTPEVFAGLRQRELSALPHLVKAVERMLEELPAVATGLTRTEATILGLVADRVRKPKKLFSAYNETEPAKFLGDWGFFATLDRLAAPPASLVTGLYGGPFRPAMTGRDVYFESELKLSLLGEDVRAGRTDYASKTVIDRWWGGTHLTAGAVWRWDGAAKRLVAPG